MNSSSNHTATLEAIAEHPESVRLHIHEAVEILDIQRVSVLIEQIRPQSPQLAVALTALVNDYRFEILQALFEEE